MPPKAERDISTERIARLVDDIQRGQNRPGSEKHRLEDCKMIDRVKRVECTQEEHAEQLSEHARQLGEGAQQFVRLQMGLSSVAEKVGALNTILCWVGGVIGTGLLGTAGAALCYVIFLMGGRP